MMGLFSFSGRTTRLGYFGLGFVQGAAICMVAILAVVAGMGAAGSGPGGSGVVGAFLTTTLVLLAGMIPVLWIGLAATARRLRDMGWPVAYGFGGLMLINLAGRALLTPFIPLTPEGLPAAAAMPWLILTSSLGSLVLLLWPSSRHSHFDDIEAMFGGDDDDAPAPMLDPEPAFARPALTPQPVRGFGRVDTGQPRATFGLRGVT